MCFPPPEEFGATATATWPPMHDEIPFFPDISQACLEDKLLFLAHRRRRSIESCERFLGELDDAMQRETSACVEERRFHTPPARRHRAATGTRIEHNLQVSDAPLTRQRSESSRFAPSEAFSERQQHVVPLCGSLSAPPESFASPWQADLSYYERRRSTTGSTTRSSTRITRSISSSGGARAPSSAASPLGPSHSSSGRGGSQAGGGRRMEYNVNQGVAFTSDCVREAHRQEQHELPRG